MALIDKKITNPIRYHQDNANTVIGQASTMKALFDQGAEDLRVKLNGVIDELLATTGAQQIGIDPAKGLGNTLADALTNIKNYMNLGASGISATTIGTGSGNTVQSQLEWLLLQVQNVVLNQIPDGTITMQKLATALANTINGNTSNIGDLATLTTTEKTNLAGAVNELVSQSAQIELELDNHETNGTHQNVNVTNTADATSATNAPLKSAGGLAVAKNIMVGGSFITVNAVRSALARSNNQTGDAIANNAGYSQGQPLISDLYVVEKNTNKYLRAVVYKQNDATLPVITTLASNGLTIAASNEGGTIQIGGWTVAANVKIVNIINGVGMLP